MNKAVSSCYGRVLLLIPLSTTLIAPESAHGQNGRFEVSVTIERESADTLVDVDSLAQLEGGPAIIEAIRMSSGTWATVVNRGAAVQVNRCAYNWEIHRLGSWEPYHARLPLTCPMPMATLETNDSLRIRVRSPTEPGTYRLIVRWISSNGIIAPKERRTSNEITVR